MILTEEVVVDSGVRDKRVVDEMTFLYFPIIFRHLALHHASSVDILENSDLLVFGEAKEHSHAVRKEHELGHVRIVDRRFGSWWSSLLFPSHVRGLRGLWGRVGIIVIFTRLLRPGRVLIRH